MKPISAESQFSLLKAFVVAKCGHKFHKKCIVKVESEEAGEARQKYVTACIKCSAFEFS